MTAAEYSKLPKNVTDLVDSLHLGAQPHAQCVPHITKTLEKYNLDKTGWGHKLPQARTSAASGVPSQVTLNNIATPSSVYKSRHHSVALLDSDDTHDTFYDPDHTHDPETQEHVESLAKEMNVEPHEVPSAKIDPRFMLRREPHSTLDGGSTPSERGVDGDDYMNDAIRFNSGGPKFKADVKPWYSKFWPF